MKSKETNIEPLDTVNVILRSRYDIEYIYSYPNTSAGRAKAEEKFVELIRSLASDGSFLVEDDELETACDIGDFELPDGNNISIVQSTLD